MNGTPEPRPHAWRGVPGLADRPLEPFGIARVHVERTRLPAEAEPPAESDALAESGAAAGETMAARAGDSPPPPPARESGEVASLVRYRVRLDDDREARSDTLVLPFPPIAADALDEHDAPPAAFEWDGTVLRAQVPLRAGTHYYGLGERAGPLERGGREHLLWNTDAWCYSEASPALYQSHPFVLALLPDGTAVGLIAETPARGRIATVEGGVEFAFEGGPFVLHRIDAPEPRAVLRALTRLIGRIAEPPAWALGYHQCRWGYESADEVRAVVRGFRERGLPLDAVWLDIDHMDRFRVFTFDDTRFPDPAGLVAELEAEGVRTVAILDPALPLDHPASEGGLAARHFVEDANGRPIVARVWPGLCRFPDFTREETRAWWSAEVRAFVERTGIAGLWNDMNEPSAFRAPAASLPDDARHRGLGGGSHARFHNLYGQLMAEATHAGLVAARPAEAPFVLTRAAHLAGSRFAATWTGDNQARWEDLAWAIPMVLNLGLSGQPFSGPDVGGFYGDPSEELFARWFELGAWLPFFRGHSEKTSCRKEPWSLGAEALGHVRRALETRMRMQPVWRSLFARAAEDGLPIARPLWFADPSDERLRTIDDAFLLGEDLLVAPVIDEGASARRVRLPRVVGGWWRFDPSRDDAAAATPLDAANAFVRNSADAFATKEAKASDASASSRPIRCLGSLASERFEGGREVEVEAPLGHVPLFVRAGAIVPLADVRPNASAPDPRRTWHVFPGEDGRASVRLREGRAEPWHASTFEPPHGPRLAIEASTEEAAARAERAHDWLLHVPLG